MVSEPNKDVIDAAIGWHLSLSDDLTADWDGFTSWLEENPAHVAAFDEVVLADAESDSALATMSLPERAANDDVVPGAGPRRRWIIAGSCLAAMLVAGVTLPRLIQDQRYQIVTGPGEHRDVDIASQGHIALNGSTRLTLDRRDTRYAMLNSGEATFAIRHDAAKPFVLQVGEDRVQDTGTVFNVVADEAGHRIEVSEGSVVYNPQTSAVVLKAGQTLFDGATAVEVVVRTKDPQAIGGWRRGRLDFQSVPIATVAADISRTLGIPITVSPVIAGQPFTGSIEIDRNPDRMRARLSALLNVDARAGGGGWEFSARDRAGG